MEQSAVIIRCENINKKFKSKTVLEDISFEIMRGEFLSLLGPSGCGKTTILRMLIGIEKPSSGRILKDGEDITNTPPKDRNIGIVFQNYSLFPNMDVYHNIAYALSAKKLEKDEIDQKSASRNTSTKSPVSSPAASSSASRSRGRWS